MKTKPAQDAEAQAQGVEADDEEGAGQRQEAGAAQRADGEHQPVEEGRHPAAAGEVVAAAPARRTAGRWPRTGRWARRT